MLQVQKSGQFWYFQTALTKRLTGVSLGRVITLNIPCWIKNFAPEIFQIAGCSSHWNPVGQAPENRPNYVVLKELGMPESGKYGTVYRN